ncbi:MAG: hypothetical protein ACI8P9_003795 [Parasphingorhabdus sp.]|jgi:uncharacterized protein (TIGR00730 family)
MKRICIYCGSSLGRNPAYIKAARTMANALVKLGIGVTYGGARIGIMGEVADTVLAGGGEVIGVMPRSLVDREIAHSGLTDLHIVDSMHERKSLMADLSDGFIALPGGIGTLEELFESLTWSQLGIHNKPCGLLNTVQYYDKLCGFLDHATSEQFVKPAHRSLLLVEAEPELLIQRMVDYGT